MRGIKDTPPILDRLVQRATLALTWERVWPVIVALMMVAAAFLTLSWLGLWLEVPAWARIAGVAVFAAATAFALSRFLRNPAPSRPQALARLDRDSGVRHRPASALEDALANPGSDPATSALWSLHQRRLQAQVARLKLAAPSPRMADRDRFALRAAALVAVAGAAFVAGPERYLRVAAAFDWRSTAAQVPGFRVDAWLDPPAYTGRAPILLETQAAQATRRVEAPAGSVLILRAPADAGFKAETTGGLALVVPEPSAGEPAAKADGDQRYSLKGDAQLVLKRSGETFAAYELHAIPDLPPTITLTEPLQPNVRGSMTLNYKTQDDYGVVSAQADFAAPSLRGKPVSGHPLVGAPHMALALPPSPGGIGEGSTTQDLSEHPWAGAKVMMTLSVRDEGGNTGISAPREMILPQRPFVKPMARALAEQRRNLVLNPDDRDRVLKSIYALMLAPEENKTGASVYLGLSTARSRLLAARTDEDLVALADFLWEMALRIEDGDLSQAERELRAAENKLREAMERGAPNPEIDKLMADVRAALDKFMQELAEKQQREGGPEQQQADNGKRNSKMLTPKDFKSMMDKIEEMARSGNMEEARKMLDKMQKMLENLQTAKRGQPNPAKQEMNKALDELDAMAREEQSLRDDTFKQDQKQRKSQKNAQGKPGQPQPGNKAPKGAQQPDQNGGEEDADADPSSTGDARSAEETQKQLKDRQEALRNRLDQLQKKLKQLGQKGAEGLGQAEEAMKDAEGALGEGESGTGKAVGPEGKALDALRKGAQQLAEAMQGQGEGEGEGDDQANDDGEGQPGEGQRQGNRQNGQKRDPLGRDDQRRNGDSNEKRGLSAEGAPAQRAQKVLEELRRRLGDPSRASEERDYLERLLKRY